MHARQALPKLLVNQANGGVPSVRAKAREIGWVWNGLKSLAK